MWDFLPLKIARGASNFTAFPHLDMGLWDTHALASITVPHGIRGGFKTKLKEVGEEGFLELLGQVEKRTRPILRKSRGSKAMVYATQRHYRSQRSEAEVDARLDADLRTVVSGTRSAVKYQPEWAYAIYDVITQKRSNIQFGLEVQFSYDCSVVRSAVAADLFAEAWVALSPVLPFVLGE